MKLKHIKLLKKIINSNPIKELEGDLITIKTGYLLDENNNKVKINLPIVSGTFKNKHVTSIKIKKYERIM